MTVGNFEKCQTMKIEIEKITNRSGHKKALARLSALMAAHPNLTPAQELEMDVLAHFIAQYEEKRFPSAQVDPVDMLEFVMESRGLTRADLAPCLGSKSKVSEVLARKRPLSLAMIRNLHRTFGIPADLLVEEYALA
jgi:HTH-type transcriptional regulator/antitoxin HigA